MAAIKGEETRRLAVFGRRAYREHTMSDRGCRLPVEPKSRDARDRRGSLETILVWPVMAIMRRIDELHVDHSFEGS